MKIYGLKNCDSCRKALKSFPDATLIDVRMVGVPKQVLVQAYRQFGMSLINTRSTTWRELDPLMRAKDPLDLLETHPTVMKRPLIRAGDNLYLGWGADVRGALGVG